MSDGSPRQALRGEERSAAASTPARAGSLSRDDRLRVREILERTGRFRDEEVDVALELFDEAVPEAGAADGARREDYEAVGAFAGERLVGFAVYGPTPATDRTWDLYWIAVDPEAQGTGGGTALLREVERRITERRARMLVVETSARDEYAGARAFYLSRGYDEAARVGEFYAPGDDRVIFTRRFHEGPAEGPGAAAR